jgi:formiminotetrahydrofolate cyclodeaminase
MREKTLTQNEETISQTLEKLIDEDTGLNRHILLLTALHLDKISEGDKEKLLECWNEILGIRPYQLCNNRFEDDV